MGKVLIPKLEKKVLQAGNLGLGTQQQCKYNKSLNEKASLFVERRCAHSKSEPLTYIAPSHHKPRPDVGRKISKRLRESFFECKRYLPSLNFHKETGYQVRSQKREVCLLALEAFFQYTDYLTLQVGKFLGVGNIEPIPILPTVKDKRMGRADYSFCLLNEINRGREAHQRIGEKRLLRAMAHLKKKNIIETETRYIKNRWGSFRSVCSIKKITDKALRELGITKKELEKERARKKKNLIKDDIRAGEIKKAEDFIKYILTEENRVVETPTNVLADLAFEEVKKENPLLVEIKKRFPGLNGPEITKRYLKWLKKKRPPD